MFFSKIIYTCKYFAPLSSPKPKHKRMKNMIDFFKIKDGELGAVNFNNMIPVTDKNYTLVDLNKIWIKHKSIIFCKNDRVGGIAYFLIYKNYKNILK